jgi:hypothetical protein
LSEEHQQDDGIRIVYTVSRRLGVWSLYRHGRALHRSPDLGRIADEAGRLATAEALRTGLAVKIVFNNVDGEGVITHVINPVPAESSAHGATADLRVGDRPSVI